jgi:hypothetical protein
MTKYCTQALFLVSPDQDFQDKGLISGITYKDVYNIYKGVLSDNTDNPTIQRIFSAFHEGLFGPKPTDDTTPTPTNDELNLEVEKFKRALFANTSDNRVVDPVETSIPPLAPGSPTQSEDPIHSTPASPIEMERPISIAVTSNVSHTFITSSQISHTTNSNIIPVAPESDVEEDSQPVPKVVRPRAKQKKGPKLPTPPPGLDSEDEAPATKKPAKKASKAASVTAPNRVLRNRG